MGQEYDRYAIERNNNKLNNTFNNYYNPAKLNFSIPSWELFQSQCPCVNCYNTNIITWHHYGCPNYSKCYISDQAMIKCDNCSMNSEFFSCKFDCGNHGAESNSTRFRYPNNLKKVFAIVGALCDDGIYSADFTDKLCESLRNQYRRRNNY